MDKLRINPKIWKRQMARQRIGRLISFVPGNRVRILLHRVINRYHISKSAFIAHGVVIAVESATIGCVAIANGNLFDGPYTLVLQDGVVIGCNNRFWSIMGGGVSQMEEQMEGVPPMYTCILRRNVLVTEEHFFDSTGGLEVGEGTWIAGRGTQVWTHGLKSGPVMIGAHNYVSTRVTMSPRSSTGESTTILPGSVVAERFTTARARLGGNPARIISVEKPESGFAAV
jgi:hypothetical protein